MSHPTIDRLKQVHTEMNALRKKMRSDAPLTANEQKTLDQLTAEYDEALMSFFLPVYYRSSMAS